MDYWVGPGGVGIKQKLEVVLTQSYYKPRYGAGLVPREDCRRRVRRKCPGPDIATI